MTTPISMLSQLAAKRKTVREFTPSKPDLNRILDALEIARQAPSGSNQQPWRFLIVDDAAPKTRIREAAEQGEKVFYETISEDKRLAYEAMGHTWRKPMLEQAPVLLVVLSDTRAPNHRPSVWIAVGYIILAIEAAGLGTVTYTPSDAQRVADALHIPDDFQVETILPIGFSASNKAKKDRKPLQDLTFYNQWETALFNGD